MLQLTAQHMTGGYAPLHNAPMHLLSGRSLTANAVLLAFSTPGHNLCVASNQYMTGGYATSHILKYHRRLLVRSIAYIEYMTKGCSQLNATTNHRRLLYQYAPSPEEACLYVSTTQHMTGGYTPLNITNVYTIILVYVVGT